MSRELKYEVKKILKKILFSKYINSTFRNVYYLIFRFNGGNGGMVAKRYLNQLNKSEFASLDELEALQRNKLNKLVKEAYEHVPYYRKIMKEKGLAPFDIKTKEDLSLFPILTKQKIRENFNDLLNVKYKAGKLKLVMTGGTTGTPLKFYFRKHEDGVRSAHWERWKKFAGVKQFDKFMYIGMDEHAKISLNYSGTFMLSGYYLMASFGLDDNLMWRYVENIRKFKPVYLRGYASACYILADFFKRNRINYPLKAVLVSSDTLYPRQRKVIEETFFCKVFDYYGQVEDAVTAIECENHNGYHVNMESCIVEIVDENGNCLREGERGLIAGTHLENYCMPLIRYCIDDLGSVTLAKCACGRSHGRIREFLGRTDDIIITPDGKKIGCGSMNQPMEYLYEEIMETQFIQKTKDLLIVRLVPTARYTLESEKKFEEFIREQVGNLIKIKFQKVDEIPKTWQGKHQLIVSEIVKNE